jgi:hypothetical protein
VEAPGRQRLVLLGIVDIAPADMPGARNHPVGAVVRVAVGLNHASLRKPDAIDVRPGLFPVADDLRKTEAWDARIINRPELVGARMTADSGRSPAADGSGRAENARRRKTTYAVFLLFPS